MNEMNVTNQLRCYYDTQRVYFKIWKFLWHYLLNITICNNYKIIHITFQRFYAHDWNHYNHKNFRNELIRELFNHFERLIHFNNDIMNDNKIIILIHYVKHVSIIKHDMSKRLNDSTKYCVICTMQKKSVINSKNKKSFQEFNFNNKKHSKRRIRFSCIVYDCKLCDIHLCKKKLLKKTFECNIIIKSWMMILKCNVKKIMFNLTNHEMNSWKNWHTFRQKTKVFTFY